MKTLLIKSTLATAIALSIAACTPADNEGVAGIGGSGYVSSGSVTGFGSVFVNGVEFETDNSTFDVDGNPDGTQDDLAIGMIVQVSGSINADGITGDATSITYDDQLQGPVTGLTAPDLDGITRSFMVLGTNVIIDSGSTSFDLDSDLPASTVFDFDTISEDNNVEVSGFFDSSGNLVATRVELKDIKFDTDSIVEIKGTIAGLSGTTFNLGSLMVDASTATLDDLPNGLEDGLFVEVKGKLNTGLTTLMASSIEAEDGSVEDSDEFELEGIITDYISDSSFKVNGIPVNASSASREPSSLVLANDTRIEVEGAIINGILIADEIESEDGDIKVHAMVTAVPPVTAANTFEVSPLPGQTITVTVSTNTQFEDDVGENKFFNINDLVANTDFVEIRGFDDGSGGIDAVEVDVKELSDVIVQGPASAATGSAGIGGDITVLGITFKFTDSTNADPTDFEDENDVNLNSGEIDALLSDINNTSTATKLLKIEDKKAPDGNAIGTADEIDIE
jgi:hypothetical protein